MRAGGRTSILSESTGWATKPYRLRASSRLYTNLVGYPPFRLSEFQTSQAKL